MSSFIFEMVDKMAVLKNPIKPVNLESVNLSHPLLYDDTWREQQIFCENVAPSCV